MKKHEVKVGGLYVAKVAGKLTTVRVDAIRATWPNITYVIGGRRDREVTLYDVTNLTTNRKTTFRSAAKFRSEVTNNQAKTIAKHGEDAFCVDGYPMSKMPDTFTIDEEGNECPDPTVTVSPTPQATTPPPSSCVTVAAPTNSLAAKLQASGVIHNVKPVASKHPLTDEQQAIIDHAPSEPVLVIEAGAGAGKTSTLVELAKSLGGRGQYTAFNTNLVAESKQKFPSACPCNTIHSLAFRSEGYKYKHRMNQQRVRSSEVAAMLGIAPITASGADGQPKTLLPGFLVSKVQQAVKRFCQSADRDIGIEHIGYITGLDFTSSDIIKLQLLPYAIAIWKDVSSPDGRLPFAHDHYVKVWQLNRPIISADYVLLDEAQDTSPVMLDVLAQQAKRGTKVILVGDSAQQIYSWRGAINALAAFPEAKRLMLSQSFRFGQVVAEVANAVLSHLQERTPLVMRGYDKINSRLSSVSEPAAVLCRTNAAAVQTMLDGIARNKRPHLIGGGDDVLAFVNAARALQQGRRTEHPELACFESWREVQAFTKTEEGEDLKLMVKLIDTFTADKIANALHQMPSEKDADFVVSTAHKSKGREWSSVKLASDFMPLSKMGDEELRLLYVAATRAQKVLDVETCPPFCGGEKKASEGWNGEGGREEVIDISEARKISNDLPAEEQVEETVAAVVETPQEQSTKPEPKRSPMDNTWSKSKNGEWLVRGRPNQSGQIEVVRKNGSKSLTIIDKVIWEDSEVALYSVR